MTTYHQNSPIGQFLAYLDSITCRCKDVKYRGRDLCLTCLNALPDEQRKALRFARGDEDRMEAFQDAKDWLDSHGL